MQNIENLETIVEQEYKPNKLTKIASYFLSKFPAKDHLSSYEEYSKNILKQLIKTKNIESLADVKIPEKLKSKHLIDEKNIDKKSLNLILTSTTALGSHYTSLALKEAMGVWIKSQVGAIPQAGLKSISRSLSEKYGIKESPENYVAYSLAVGVINAGLMMLAAYGLMQLPWVKPIGQAKLYLTYYTMFFEIPFRAVALGFKQPLGILPAEAAYRFYRPYIKPILEKKVYPHIRKVIAGLRNIEIRL